MIPRCRSKARTLGVMYTYNMGVTYTSPSAHFPEWLNTIITQTSISREPVFDFLLTNYINKYPRSTGWMFRPLIRKRTHPLRYVSYCILLHGDLATIRTATTCNNTSNPSLPSCCHHKASEQSSRSNKSDAECFPKRGRVGVGMNISARGE
ncbi:hypothetical protein LSAT2_019467 [Lamellibrachia satsuma]|nr:hypothetical protein LSAT2_019467 [Lamellibrachia satsuma]